MKPTLKAHSQYLKKLKKLSRNQVKVALKLAEPQQVRCLCECAANLLVGNIPLTKAQKKALHRHRKLLRKLADKRKTLEGKKRIIVQSGGGFLFSLIPAAISAIASLIR